MPFFKRPCFKFRKNKKKNKRKEDNYMKTITDTVTPVNNEEIIHRSEVKSEASLKEDDAVNDLNHSFATKACNDSVSVTSQMAEEENKDNDYSHNTDPQKSETSVDNTQEHINVKSHLIAQEKNPSDENGPSAETVDGSTVSYMNEQNVNKLQEADKNKTDIVMEVLSDPESNDFQEKMYIQKSIEIINSITVNSDVFKKMEELKDLEMALNKLRQKIKEDEKEKSTRDAEVGDAEHMNDDSHKIVKISDSHRTLDREIHTSTYCDNSSTLSEEKREKQDVAMADVPISDELNGAEKNLCEDRKIDSKSCLISSLDENQRVAAYSSTLQTKSSENEILETEDKKVLHVSKHKSHDYNNNSKHETENSSDVLGKEDALDTSIPMAPLVKNNENIIPISKTVIFDSGSKDNKSENIIQTKIEKNKSEENSMKNEILSETDKHPSEINETCKVLKEKSLSENEYKAEKVTYKNVVAMHLDSNMNGHHSKAEFAEMSYESTNKTHVGQSVETFNMEEESECKNVKKFQNDKEFVFTNSKSVEDSHHIENDTLISEFDYAITKSDRLSLNTMQRNAEDGCDLKSYSGDYVYTDKTNYIIQNISDNYSISPLKTQNHYSENVTSLGNKSEATIPNCDSFDVHCKEDSYIINSENANTNFDSEKTFDYGKKNKYDAFTTKKQEQDKYNLELSRRETDYLKHFKERKVDSNSNDSHCGLKELQNKNILLDKETENKSVYYLKQSTASSRLQSNNKYGSDLYLNDNSHLKTPSKFANETSNNKTGVFSTTPVKKQQFDSPIRTQTKSPSIQLDFDDILNNSAESLFVNVEYCKDDNEFSEDSEENKCQAENPFQSQESSYSSQEGIKYQEKQSRFSRFNEECQISNLKSNLQNQIKNLNYFQKDFDSYCENKEEIADNVMPLKYKENDRKNFSEFMVNYNICKQLAKKEPQQGTAEDTTLEKEAQNKISSSNLPQKQDMQITSENKRRMKSLSTYSLSECSISSDSSNLCASGDTKEEKLKAKSSDSFIFTEMGDSGAEDSRQNKTLISCNKEIENSQKSTKSKHAVRLSKKKMPKMRKGEQIKISITKKCSKTGKYKTPKTSSNGKYISNTSKNTTKLQSGDAINLLSYFDHKNESSQLNRIKNTKYFKIPDDFETSFSINDRDTIEFKRKENINLFNKRKQKSLSEMGPNLRTIPIKNTDSFKIKTSRIEVVCLSTELSLRTKTDCIKRSSPDSQKILRFYEDKFPHMRKESPSSRKDVTVQNVMVPVELLCDSDTESVNGGLEKMTPIRRKILDSSRSLRSPKYFSLSCKETDNNKTYPLKPIFIKSPKQKIVVAQLLNDEKDIYELKESYKIYSPNSRKCKIASPRKDSAEYSPRPCIHHTQNYRATSPVDLKSKFDEVFKKYARRGRCNGELISYKRSTEWLRDAGVVGKVLTAEEATDAFKCEAGVKIALNKGDYRIFLKKLTRLKKLNYNEVYEKLCDASTRWIVA